MWNYTEHHDTIVRNTIKTIEDEVLELKKTITRKRALVRNLKNLLLPVNRLPNEILLACFGQAMQDWVDENDGVDERAAAELPLHGWSRVDKSEFELPCTPVFAIFHVSRHWRQLATNTPSLWTNLIITSKFNRHLKVFRKFLHRAKGMPIAANIRSLEPPGSSNSAGVSLMEVIMPLINTQQIHALKFFGAAPQLMLPFLRMVNQTSIGPPSPPSIVFSRLATLSSFELCYPGCLTFSRLRSLLSAAPQLKTLELQHASSLDDVECADNTVIDLPMLENLTLIDSSLFHCKLLDSLSAPHLRQLKLLAWDDWAEGDQVLSCLFIHNTNSFGSSLRVPKFSQVQNLTLSSNYKHYYLNINLIRAFPRVTHLTLHSPIVFFDDPEEPSSLEPPIFQCLQCLTVDFAFEGAGDTLPESRFCFTWLQKPQDRADRPLLISVLDRSTKSMRDANENLFRYYKELQQYGELDESSSRLNEFMRWEADGEPAILHRLNFACFPSFLVDSAC
ncbi:hypothetical protein BJ138DRAFT_1151459 [Hygrophoropsis aurantiaca]|uniref:Uncharacterized protein n=1 Tax=Hygrophoropsis aurantiaca TaxID=72124 RepID=A0ACB8ACK2_9AGAM|nr:hypothetical protein BJ138DRAFT_1151459 [Hygrophoropsis aurantiaca]